MPKQKTLTDREKAIQGYKASLKPLQIELTENHIQIMNKLAEFSGYSGGAKGLVEYLVHSVVDGARRPGAWERQLLYPLGIEANNECYQETSDQLLEHYQALDE